MGVTILPKKFYDAKNEQNELLQQIATSLGVTAGNLQDAINIANQASLNAQNKITELNANWNLLTTAQQQDAEVVTARQSTVKNKTFASLDARLEAAEQDLSVHQAETAQDNVHGLGDRPMVSSAVITYYIDAVAGSDTNNGLAAETAFKTWAKARTMIPRFLSHTLAINIIGDLAEIIDIPSVLLKNGVYLLIAGSTTTAADQVVSGIKIGGSGGGAGGSSILIRYLESSGLIDIQGANYVTIYSCNPRNTGGVGIQIRGSSCTVSACDFGTDVVQDAIVADSTSIVASYSNQGNATRFGLYSAAGAIICKGDAGQPMGTTANEYKTVGGQIFS
jgi:hypothetical protein